MNQVLSYTFQSMHYLLQLIIYFIGVGIVFALYKIIKRYFPPKERITTKSNFEIKHKRPKKAD